MGIGNRGQVARRVALVWAGWTLYALFSASQNFLSRAYSTRVEWKPAFLYALVDAYPWAVLTPLALWLAGIVLSPKRLEIAPLAWAAVGIPLLWGVWITVDKALALFE